MQKVHRKFGTFLKRSADEQDVGVILQEYRDADQMLDRVSRPILNAQVTVVNCTIVH